MTLTVAERSRRFHARRRATAEAEQRTAYEQRKATLAKEKARTLAHFRRWTSQLRLDTGAKWKLEPFQEAFVRDLFKNKRENWLIIPEGNAKTTLVAGLALYHLQFTLDAKIAAGASSREQAGLMYDQAEGFIDRARDDEIEAFKDFELHPGYRRIEYVPTRSKLEIKAADHNTGDGIIPTLCLIDELHRHRDLKLYRTWSGKLSKRNGQLIVISTAGEPGGEFEQARERIRQSTAANITRKPGFVRAEAETVVLHEWAVDEDGNVEDLKVVKRANPLKAITVKSLQDKLAGPGMTLPHWRRLTCNLPTRSDSAAITESEWAKAKTTEGIPEGARIWVGLDVAWKWDTTAIVPLWVRDADFRLLGPAAILTPPRDGQMLDIEVVKAAFMGIHARNPIHTVVMDPALAADLAQWVAQEMGCTIISRGQSTSLAVVDYQKFMEGLRGGTLKHSGDAGLTQHALNAIARIDRFGAARFDRSTPTRNVASEQDRRVIDALTAAAMVNAQALVQSEPTPEPFAVWA